MFVGGWVAAAYVAWGFDTGGGIGTNTETAYRIQILLSHGLQATIGAGILWGVAAFLWVKILPAAPEDGPDTV